MLRSPHRAAAALRIQTRHGMNPCTYTRCRKKGEKPQEAQEARAIPVSFITKESLMTKRCGLAIAIVFFAGVTTWISTAHSQAGQRGAPGTENGIATFQTQCSVCHGNPKVERAPSPSAIREMTPERIYEALTTGVMKDQGDKLPDQDKRGVAEFMSGRPLGSSKLGDAKNMPNPCRNNPALT